MTLIIGIKCSDGIVMGADGAATLGSLGTRTALQPAKKLSILKNIIIIGVSGPVGLGQRLKGEMNTLWEQNAFSDKKPHEAMTIVSKKFREHIIPELETAAIASKAIGNLALESALSSTLVALPIKSVPCLFQFNHQGSPEETTEELPFASIGSGQGISDPFLGLIRRIFWASGCPNIVDAIFATVWTLRHAILISPGGVADPIQIISLMKNQRGDWQAKEYSELELKEHDEAIKAAENSLQSFRTSIQSENNATKIPEPSS